MSKGVLALLIRSGDQNWAPERWRDRFRTALPGRDVVSIPDDAHDPLAIDYAAVWKPKHGELAAFPNLKVIFNLGAGVDAVLSDPQRPDVPLVRVAADDLTSRMTEYVVMHTLMHHRQQSYLAGCQTRREWAPREQWPASAVRVGVLGLGVLGRHAAAMLHALGFQVAGWSATRKNLNDVRCYAGQDELSAFLARTDILICLLPLTPQTRGILCRELFVQLAKNGPLGGPVVINAGRGGLQNESDILDCLDNGVLKAVTLDVFEAEPLNPASRLWRHPAVTISPHNAADTDPDTISSYVAGQILNFEMGGSLENVVDRSRGY